MALSSHNMDYSHFQPGERRTYQEMRQKPTRRDTFFSMRSDPQAQRPISVDTEFVDTDWDDDDILTDTNDSPRGSLQSSGQPSFTTVSSYDEAPTPGSGRSREADVDRWPKQIQGPRGPHLFRSSTDQSSFNEFHEDVILTLSPITPKAPRAFAELLPAVRPPRRSSPFQYSREELDPSKLASWKPEMLAQSMLNAGIELSVAERFIENDINGAILITLKFEDLRELDIPSFGVRTKVWHQIQALRDNRPASPRPSTPIEDAPSREARRETRRETRREESRRRPSSSRRRRQKGSEDNITPMESVSIIGIEQVIPKPHKCSKGENCSKWRKQQRLLEDFKKANPNVDVQTGGTVVIVGDAGNPATARAINPNDMRPTSDAVPSVVASSDILGANGLPAFQYLQETTLRNLQARDPQDNVRQFLNFQHQGGKFSADDVVPPTPPFELAPPAPQVPHHGLRRLPKLAIPASPRPARPAPPRASTAPVPQQQQQQQQQQYELQSRRESQQHELQFRRDSQPPEPQPRRASQQQELQTPRASQLPIQQHQQDFAPYRMDKADPKSPDLETPRNPYRFGTPFSEVDVPVTAVPIGPVSRDISQSVPPDMNYRASPSFQPPTRTQSRASRRPSFPLLPALDENKPVRVSSKTPSPSKAPPLSKTPSPPRAASARPSQPIQPPPRFDYPWSPNVRQEFETAIPPPENFLYDDQASSESLAKGVSFQGPMKKRKQRMLRNEWQDGYFTLRGTRLNMHRDAAALDRTLEYVDIDDYAIACSSLASTSKLSAALKAVRISHTREKSDPVASFSFQLVPQDKNTARLRKRESTSVAPAAATAEGVNGTGKTHHFAVKNRDERIDWMREMMLAKAMKQKGQGFEISVNGSMI